MSHDSSHLIQTCQLPLAIMFLKLILITQVTAEWVEISQQHYTHRKPLRPHNKPFIEETTTNRYMNHSVTEFNWNQGVHRVPSVGDVKRVQLEGNAVQTSPVKFNSRTQVVKSSAVTSDEEKIFPVKDFGIVQRVSNDERVIETPVKSENVEIRSDIEASKNDPYHDTRYEYTQGLELVEEFKSDDKLIGTVHRVPNIGNVKRVQLANTPVKSPSLKIKPEPIEKRPSLVSDVLRPSYKPNDNFRNSNWKSEFQTKKVIKIDEDFEDTDTRIGNTKYKQDAKAPSFNSVEKLDKNIIMNRRPEINTSTREFDNYTRLSNIPISEFITGDVFTESTYFPTDVNPLVDLVTQQSLKYEHNPIEINQKIFVTKEKNLNKSVKPTSNNNSEKTNSKLPDDINNKEDKNRFDDGPQSNEHDNKDNFEENSGVKENTIDNVLKFIKVVADTISSNTRRGVGGKVRYLQKLKDTILANIEYRIDSTWPDDLDHTSDAAARRRSRSTHANARGHVVEFPSSEGALMTISFLTFAVFLIKLVLQVIHTYKNKTMMVAPLVVASARTATTAGRAAFNNRHPKRN